MSTKAMLMIMARLLFPTSYPFLSNSFLLTAEELSQEDDRQGGGGTEQGFGEGGSRLGKPKGFGKEEEEVMGHYGQAGVFPEPGESEMCAGGQTARFVAIAGGEDAQKRGAQKAKKNGGCRMHTDGVQKKVHQQSRKKPDHHQQPARYFYGQNE